MTIPGGAPILYLEYEDQVNNLVTNSSFELNRASPKLPALDFIGKKLLI